MERSAATVAQRIRLAREGSADALGDLLAAYRGYLRILAASCLDRDVRSKADASDVVQETLLRAHEAFPQFRGTTEGEWVMWVRKILVRNLAQLHRRYALPGRRVDRERSLAATVERSSQALRGLVSAHGLSPSQQAQHRESSLVLADALAEMDEEDREVVILRNLQELDWKEIALRTGHSADAARMRWTRALRRLSTLLKARMP